MTDLPTPTDIDRAIIVCMLERSQPHPDGEGYQVTVHSPEPPNSLTMHGRLLLGAKDSLIDASPIARQPCEHKPHPPYVLDGQHRACKGWRYPDPPEWIIEDANALFGDGAATEMWQMKCDSMWRLFGMYEYGANDDRS